jgi:hypothetical protein
MQNDSYSGEATMRKREDRKSDVRQVFRGRYKNRKYSMLLEGFFR